MSPEALSPVGVCVIAGFDQQQHRTGAPRSPGRTWDDHDIFRMLSLTEQWISGLIEQKAIVGFAHRFRPTYAGANVGHPSGPVVDQILL